MRALTQIHDGLFGGLERLTVPVMTTLARFVFAATLLLYYWNSGATKLGDGPLGFLFPSDGAYIQIFPKTVEAAGYDFSALGAFHWAVVVAGTWAEFLLPLAIVLGLFTRLAALGMIGFIVVQSWVDLFGHGGIAQGTLGAWFDRMPDSIILDQRAFWVFVLLYLVFRGGGPLSVDRLLSGRADGRDAARQAAA
ncbi:DoxX family membrane protein [Alphaproteobacteria bacterium GH1-50]|uniref:DoxX family membrane protein n=1 Tax=Kangsaoukella pontilimi TaxID=2691042 RepID=A0A7C9J4H0_9RHOB|nr:DoxX family membrane protein [Kangsaoukella pontilimi]MXQ08801.1 DoxX family membrane protein [Kangsaoukella pontilimi]